MNKATIAILAATVGATLGTVLRPGIQEIALIAIVALVAAAIIPRLGTRRSVASLG